MKKLKGFKLANVTLASALALALSGCGDEPLNSNSIGGNEETVSLSGTVADGYLSNAIICLDLNANAECDDNEPTGTSGAGGEFIFDTTQSQIDANPLLVEITSDTIDEDYPNKTLTPFTLSAPAGFTFVSPITTMIQSLIEQDGMTASAAEEQIKLQLGTTVDLKTDYIAGKISGSDEAEFDKLHKIAQVAARIIADKVADPENGSASTKDVSIAIMVALIPELENLTEQVETAIETGEDFDPDALATEIGATIVIDIIETDTILDEYVLISSVGAESEITENMVIGEWSTGSKIAAGTYDGLNTWTITKGPESDKNWGSVLALSDGFEGDFSNFNKLKLQIATSGGYEGGYAIAIKAGGVESGDIVLSVDDDLRTWQDVEIDLSDYDLSSIEYIAIYAIGGTANVSEIHIADLALLEIEEKDVPDVPVIPDEPVTEDYVLISSTGEESEINENTVIGEWSTGSQIDAESTYDDLDAWTITSAVVGDANDNNWGTVLSLSGGFVGDFSEYDELKLKIATSGGYAGGYFMQIAANGVVSGDILLSVSDSVTGWQDVEVDLANYDLSSIEAITIFAIGGEANVSKIHIADLSLGQDDSVPVEILEEYALISSTGAESQINENTEVGEWSQGSVIDSESNYEGLDAWMVTSGGGWGTVLAFSGGFDGDFSEFDELRVKIATSGGYAEGYYLKIQTNGVESADIPLTVSDSTTGWQDVVVDLEGYDLTSIEYITLFAKTGTANVSKFYVADLALVELDDNVTAPDPEKVALEKKVSEAAEFVEADYTAATWAVITAALAMPETTQAEMIAKTAAITAAIDGLVETDPEAVDVTALSAAITTADNNLSLTTIGDEVGQVSQADWQEFSDALTAAEVIRDAAASQAAINQAIIDLASAQTDFNNSKIVDETDPELELGPNLVVNGDFDSSDLADNAGSVGEWNYYTNTGTVVAIADSQMTAVVTEVGGGQWDNQIWNQIQVTEEGDYVVKLTASSTVDRDILIRVDAIGMNGNGTTSTASDVIAHLTSTPQEFTLYVSGSAFTADAAFKLVTSLGVLEAANTTSVASTVTFDNVYLGTLAEAVPVDTAELETAISTAQVLHDGGADETLKTAYQAAIDVAQAVVDDVDATQTDVDAALAALAIATSEFDPSIEVPEEGNLVINGNFSDSTVGTGSDVGQWNYYTSTGTVVAIADGDMTAEVTEVGGQWDNQITNEVHVTEEGAYVVKVTASSTVDRDVLIRVDGIEMGNDGTLSTASDIIANLTSTPQTFTRYFNGIGFTNNARFKVVMSVGGLEAAGTTSVASTVTFHDVYLGTFTGDIPTDIATLSSAITVATNVFNAAVEGTETGQYTTSKADLQAAIDAAQEVVDTLDITQEQADAALTALTAARTTFEAGLVVEAIPGAQIATPSGDINYVNEQWDTGTTQDLMYEGDATYSPSIQLVGTGGWGTTLAMTGIPAGVLAGYDSIDFKIKTTDFTEIKVKVPEVEMGYALTSGTDLGDGWVQMSIPMSDFGDVAPAAAEQFAIFGAGGSGTILLTEITFSLAP